MLIELGIWINSVMFCLKILFCRFTGCPRLVKDQVEILRFGGWKMMGVFWSSQRIA
ncbi:hypothetical protein LINPERHAP1_LOCUS15001 [Linum perenne]